MNDGICVEVVDGGHEALLEFLLGGDADVAQDRTGQLGEEALDEIEPGAVLGSEGELEPAPGLIGEPSSRLPGDMRGMIVEDQVDRRVGWVGGIEDLQELDELAAAVTVLDQGVNLAGHQIEASQQGHCAVALVFVVAGKGRVHAGLGRQIGCRRCDRLDTRLLVVGDHRHRLVRLLLCSLLLEDFHLAINAQHFGHLLRKLGVAALQVVAHLVRFHLFLIEDLANRALHQVGEARVPFRRSMLPCMVGQKPCRPQFMRIAQFLCLATCQRRQPRFGFQRVISGCLPG